MGYIVESILMRRLAIENKIDTDIEDDDFEKLLSINCAITKLENLKLIGQKDKILLHLVGENPSWENLAELLNSNRPYVMKRFFDLCNLLTNYLGEEFSDESLLKSHNLNKVQLQRAKEFLNSKRKWSTK